MGTGTENKQIKIHNKSDKPDNIVQKENEIYLECEELENQLPKFLRGYFSYLKGNVLPKRPLSALWVSALQDEPVGRI